MDEASIRARVSRLLADRILPCETPDQTWAGRGMGLRCIACETPIAPTEVEYEVDFSGRTLRLHRRCHEIWLEECEPLVGR
jgi:hypothetical protein